MYIMRWKSVIFPTCGSVYDAAARSAVRSRWNVDKIAFTCFIFRFLIAVSILSEI